MPRFHKLKVKDITKETPDCVSLTFEIPENLKEKFSYKQGQYLTLKLNIKGEELRRSYSVCSSPIAEADMRIAIKAVEKGKMSTYLNNGIAIGDEMEVMEPMGNFYTEMPAGEVKNYVGFAAGSGITPIMSLLKTALATNSENRFTLFYGNRSTADIIFRDELNQLVEQYAGRLSVQHILSREKTNDPLFEGRISPEKAVDLLTHFEEIKTADEYFLCGPYDMIMGLKDTLIDFGATKENIHFELFTTDVPKTKENEDKTESIEKASLTSKVTVVLDGEETEISVGLMRVFSMPCSMLALMRPTLVRAALAAPVAPRPWKARQRWK